MTQDRTIDGAEPAAAVFRLEDRRVGPLGLVVAAGSAVFGALTGEGLVLRTTRCEIVLRATGEVVGALDADLVDGVEARSVVEDDHAALTAAAFAEVWLSPSVAARVE